MKRTSASPVDNLSPLGDAVLVSGAAETAADERNLVVLRNPDELPPILAGHLTPQLRARAESFFAGVAELFERWVTRRPSPHTQRAYRRDVLSFVDFLGLPWPHADCLDQFGVGDSVEGISIGYRVTLTDYQKFTHRYSSALHRR